MKIDSFDLELGAARRFTQTYSKRTTHRFSFVNIMDGRLARARPAPETAGFRPAGGTKTSPWYEPVILNGSEGVSLTAQFRFELENMRQMMSAIMENLGKVMSGGCTCHLDSIYQIYTMPVSRFSDFSFWQLQETATVSYREAEQTMVSSGGIIRTADNREIDFSLDLKMERSFLQERYFSRTRTGYALVDPLIIQTDMGAPGLSGAGFSFDLDLDGENEDLPMPAQGAGFLSLDLNEDGEINDGTELFGPSTGDGFSELAAYDLDGNDWIDENDPVFDRLTLWEQAEAGGMALTRIRDAGIGAIYLKGVESPFDLRSEDNDLLARVTKTSVALTEDGEALPVQEMDYNV